jgi:hypothetical protein
LTTLFDGRRFSEGIWKALPRKMPGKVARDIDMHVETKNIAEFKHRFF